LSLFLGLIFGAVSASYVAWALLSFLASMFSSFATRNWPSS
jgi:hypothetical protein